MHCRHSSSRSLIIQSIGLHGFAAGNKPFTPFSARHATVAVVGPFFEPSRAFSSWLIANAEKQGMKRYSFEKTFRDGGPGNFRFRAGRALFARVFSKTTLQWSFWHWGSVLQKAILKAICTCDKADMSMSFVHNLLQAEQIIKSFLNWAKNKGKHYLSQGLKPIWGPLWPQRPTKRPVYSVRLILRGCFDRGQ